MDIELVEYVSKARQQGMSPDEIRHNLLQAGWEADLVENALRLATPPPLPGQPYQNLLQPKTATPRFLGKKAALITAAALVVLAAGAYAWYVFGYNNPAAVWERFVRHSSPKTYQSKLDALYTDAGDSTDNSSIFQLKDISFDMSGNFYIDTSDINKPYSSAVIKYTFGSGNTNFSTGMEYRILGKKIYFKIGDNPFLRSMFAAAGQAQKIDWLMIDLDALQKQSDFQSGALKGIYNFNPDTVFDQNLKNSLAQMWKDSSLIKVQSFVGKEQVSGTAAFHYKNSLNKDAVKKLLGDSVNKIADAIKKSGSSVTDSDRQKISAIVSALVDKLEIKEFETWVGVGDLNLRRIHLLTNAPSISSAVKAMSNSALGQSSDAKRLADSRQMATALELYFNDNNGYPESLSQLVPTYISQIPIAPAPAQGNCSDYFNTYRYAPSGTQTIIKAKKIYGSYELTFCLGGQTGGYSAGLAKLSPSGIEGGIACPQQSGQCRPAQSQSQISQGEQDKIIETINKIDFSARFKFDADYSDYGKKLDVQAPSGATDIMQILNSAQADSRNAKRVADIRQFASGLELYFNDFNKYPGALSDLKPKYIGIVPEPPVPNDGSCSVADNVYSYKKIKDNSYLLTFCLGKTTGGYQAGKNTLTEAGIQ